MVRLILIAVAIFLAIYLLSRRFNASQQDNDGNGDGDVVNARSGGFLMVVIAVIAVLSLIFILSRLGVSFVGLLQKAMALLPIIRAFLPF